MPDVWIWRAPRLQVARIDPGDAALLAHIDTVICLQTQGELERLGEAERARAVGDQGWRWAHVPIPDFAAPTHTDLVQVQAALQGPTLIHCRAGLGRSGSVAAALLIEQGVPPHVAISQVRAARPGAIESTEQERWLRGLRSGR